MSEKLHRPQLIVLDDANEVSQSATHRIESLVRENPRCTLGLATGGTPVGTYERLVAVHRETGLSFRDVRTFNLDEYVGLDAEHPQSFAFFMRQNLFAHLDVPTENTRIPDGTAADPEEHCRHYERCIGEQGGIDLQLLGIGHNGHIAFNEPGSPRDSRTREVTLTDETIRNNARFFESPELVPKTAITMGIGTILETRSILLIAFGEGKREAIRRMMDGPVSPEHPASLLQHHPDVTVLVDRAAAPGQ